MKDNKTEETTQNGHLDNVSNEMLVALRLIVKKLEAKFDESLKNGCEATSNIGLVHYNAMASAYADSVVEIGNIFPQLKQEWDK